ncbi:MAG TPA: YebC/PmpR family DNA-binding transcriptional regulator, partial [Candidatus Dormibacteraeota bacterium]|nr:YebC/PmpR family DNA-binding transcriptional regulator [Candidatus Dormibacteraeota bacterium]
QDSDAIGLLAIEQGADDVQVEGEGVEIYVAPDRLEATRQGLIDAGQTVERAEVTMHPSTLVEVEPKQAQAVVRLLEALEDHDDVQEVHCNAVLPDDVLARV